jgi:hypothetical protein
MTYGSANHHPKHPCASYAALKAAHSRLRWPGGCFADEYHWRDGIGPGINDPSVLIQHRAASSRQTLLGRTSLWICAS